MKKIFDYAIFGGGVVGACILNKLTRLGKSAIMLEKNSDVATGQSKANSGLVHAGFDAKPNTLKAKLNVRGNQLFEPLCAELGVEFKKCGAVVVDKTDEIPKQLLKRGLENKVEGLEIISSEKIHALVPNLKQEYKYALYSKKAGLVSPYFFTIALCEQSVINGAVIEFNFDTDNVLNNDEFTIKSKDNRLVKAKTVINCAGYGYNEIASLLGEEKVDIQLRRGEYFVLDNTAKDFVSLSVFPAPSDKGKGILATPTIDGNILLGPNSQVCDYDTMTTSKALDEIRQGINNMFDNVPWKKVIRNYSGIRTVVGDDFYICLGKNKNVVNIAGICSPGLSSSPAIAEYVCFDLLKIQNKEKTLLPRQQYTKMNKLSLQQKNDIISKDESFGKIVCKCEKISEGEILQAIRSPLRPKSIDGIKRRVRAGMGRCQGGFCALKVANLIAKENNIKLEDVLKENTGSNIAIDDFSNGYSCLNREVK